VVPEHQVRNMLVARSNQVGRFMQNKASLMSHWEKKALDVLVEIVFDAL
jgi:hypothetical protein